MVIFIKEIVGYLGMIFVVTSFFMQNIKWLRLFNIIGGTLCCVYGFVTHTYPTGVLNLSLVIVNIFMLIKDYIKNKKVRINNESE